MQKMNDDPLDAVRPSPSDVKNVSNIRIPNKESYLLTMTEQLTLIIVLFYYFIAAQWVTRSTQANLLWHHHICCNEY
jgi:hypothetical protein